MAEAKITVEASLIIPLIISIICALLYEALQSCDRGVISMAVDRIIQEEIAAGDGSTQDEQDSYNVSQIIKEKIQDGLMIYSVEEVSYERKKNEVSISVYAEPGASYGIAGIFRHAFGKYKISRKVNIDSICSAVRKMDIVRSESE